MEIVPLPKAPQDGMELLPLATAGGSTAEQRTPPRAVKFNAKFREEQPRGKLTWEKA
jgi:hypothetical protein